MAIVVSGYVGKARQSPTGKICILMCGVNTPNHKPHSESTPDFVQAPLIARRLSVTPRYILQLAEQGRIPSRDRSGLENRGKPLCLPGAQRALATVPALALERIFHAHQSLLAPPTGGLAVNTQTAGDFGRGDSLLKQAHCFQPTLLESGLINGSMQSHEGTLHAGCIMSL